MTKSYNGWPADPNPSKINVERFAVPGMNRTIMVRKEIAPLMLALIMDYDRTVDRIEPGIFDDWSFTYRPVRGYESKGDAYLSNHSSGTALDLNAAKYPMNMHNMNRKQRAACRQLVKKYQVIQWGGDFNRIDEMHFEIKPGTTIADVKRVIAALRLGPDGKPEAPNKWPGKPIKEGDRGPAVKAIQAGLGIHVDGIFGPQTAKAVKAFRRARPALWPAQPIVTEKAYAAITKRLA